jgi:Response regulator containing CheY-like receiver domain and AraC-type DNA-binding domain
MPKIPEYNVMLVEDEPLLLRSLERHVESIDLGFKVAAKAQNGQEALELLKKMEIHLVISDIIMPLMSGLDLLTQINRYYPNIAVVLLSGYADFNFAQHAIRESALDYILKPITREKIENILMKAKAELSQYYQLIEDESLSGQTAEQTMEYVRTYLRKHYNEQIDLSSIAFKLGVSSAYLTKLFNKYEKCSPIKYLTDLRLVEAKHLLYNTTLTIKEISERVGYQNQFYFSRVFRKIYKISPTEYRANPNRS